MFNVVSRYINQVSVGKNIKRKHEYAIDFKMACAVVRKTLRLGHDYDKVFGEMLMYVIPIRPDRKDNRKAVRPKTAIWFMYRVA